MMLAARTHDEGPPNVNSPAHRATDGRPTVVVGEPRVFHAVVRAHADGEEGDGARAVAHEERAARLRSEHHLGVRPRDRTPVPGALLQTREAVQLRSGRRGDTFLRRSAGRRLVDGQLACGQHFECKLVAIVRL